MTRAHADPENCYILRFEDPVSHWDWRAEFNGGDCMFYGEGVDDDDGEIKSHTFWCRASDAASIGDWLRRVFVLADWRIDAESSNIPLEPKMTADEVLVLRAMDAKRNDQPHDRESLRHLNKGQLSAVFDSLRARGLHPSKDES